MKNIEKNNNQIITSLNDLEKFDEESGKSLSGNVDQILLKHIIENDSDLKSKNKKFIDPNPIWKPVDTNKFRVAMIVAPSWSVIFPHYGVAKLTALLRSIGYSVKVYDINVESFHYFLKNYNKDLWLSERHYLWTVEDNFKRHVLPGIKHILDKTINDILNSNVRVVGLSLFVSNLFASIYIAKKIREANPNICIIAGGPETITNSNRILEGQYKNTFNYIIQGEAEESLVSILEDLPDDLPVNELVGNLKSRLTLEEYPYADYSDYNIKNYKENGVSIETSRGCIAQCSFCTETYFWKFRSQDFERVANEIEHYVKVYKTRRLWFVDSLANGNLKNFEKLINLLLEKKLNVKWHTMVRCDGRMDYIFIRKAVAAGCTALAFGVESGSQKVLNDMRKKVDVWEIEDNIRDCKRAGMWNHVTWMVGFPTEEPIDHFHSMQVFYNIRKWLPAVSLGETCSMAPGTDIEKNCRKYNIVNDGDFFNNKTLFLNVWYTEGYKNTMVHRFLRLKFAYIWLEILRDHANSILTGTQKGESMKDYYTFNIKNLKSVPEYVKQDFNVKFDHFEGFSGTLVNEYIGFCYTLYKYFNRCTFTYKSDTDLDLRHFGNFLIREYKSEIFFTVDKSGNFKFIIDHEFQHTTREEYLKEQFDKERNNKDMSFKERIEKKGHISEWQTLEPQIRETIHEQYNRK